MMRERTKSLDDVTVSQKFPTEVEEKTGQFERGHGEVGLAAAADKAQSPETTFQGPEKFESTQVPESGPVTIETHTTSDQASAQVSRKPCRCDSALMPTGRRPSLWRSHRTQ